MYRARFLLAPLALLMTVPAVADAISVSSNTVGTLVIEPGPGSGIFADDPIARIYRSDAFGFGAGFAAFTSSNSDSIYFENGAMSASAFNGAKAVTQVDISVTNEGPDPILDRMQSTLFESSFGFYVGRFGPGRCSGLALPDCEAVTDGSGFSGFHEAAGSTMGGIAGVNFAFEVLYDGALIRSIGGSILMTETPGGISFIENFGPAGQDHLSVALQDFALDGIDDYRYVYEWNTSPFEVIFPTLLAPGATAVVSYRITTESWSRAVINDETSRNMIVGFACVRDPVGRGAGSVSQLQPMRAALSGVADSLTTALDNTCQDELPFESNVLNLPVLENGVLVFTSPVPEPASWAMLIAGFGLVGAASRRRRLAMRHIG